MNDYRHESCVKYVITADIDTTEPVITVEYLTLLRLLLYMIKTEKANVELVGLQTYNEMTMIDSGRNVL